MCGRSTLVPLQSYMMSTVCRVLLKHDDNYRFILSKLSQEQQQIATVFILGKSIFILKHQTCTESLTLVARTSKRWNTATSCVQKVVKVYKTLYYRKIQIHQ